MPPHQRKSKKQQRSPPKITFLDILINLFVYADNTQYQKEIIKVLIRFMNIRRELLRNFQRTILIFRDNFKPSLERLERVLKQTKLLMANSTIWEMPSQEDDFDKLGLNPPLKTSGSEQDMTKHGS